MKKAEREKVINEMLKQNIEQKKRIFKKYADTIIKYGFSEICHQATGYDNLWRNDLKKLFEKVNELKIKDSSLRRQIIFGVEPLGKKTEKERLESDIKYHDKRLQNIKRISENLPLEIKEKIVEDIITFRLLWEAKFPVWNKLHKLEQEQKSEKKVKKTKKKGKK